MEKGRDIRGHNQQIKKNSEKQEENKMKRRKFDIK